MISGWCLASDKTKMSKSKGNVVTPVALIEEKGTDAVRYWASTSKLGTDTAFSEDLLKIGRKLVTKLWNASKFAALQLQHLEGTPTTAIQDSERGVITETLDRWVLTRLHHTITKATEAFELYEYSNARSAIEDFFWNDFCDNYLELVKSRAYGNDNAASQQSACYTIYHCLNGILRLFAPVVPHITEELFSHIFEDIFQTSGSLHVRGMWPSATDYPCDMPAEQTGIAVVSILDAIRKAKSEKSLSIKYPIAMLHLHSSEAESQTAIEKASFDLKAAGNIAEIVWEEGQGDAVCKTEDERFTLAIIFAEEAEKIA